MHLNYDYVDQNYKQLWKNIQRSSGIFNCFHADHWWQS